MAAIITLTVMTKRSDKHAAFVRAAAIWEAAAAFATDPEVWRYCRRNAGDARYAAWELELLDE
jgi:hypothetical protein